MRILVFLLLLLLLALRGNANPIILRNAMNELRSLMTEMMIGSLRDTQTLGMPISQEEVAKFEGLLEQLCKLHSNSTHV